MCEALEELMKDELDARELKGRQMGEKTGWILGEKNGEKTGKNRVNNLVLQLSSLGRTSDIVKAAADEAYQEQLFKEFGL